MISSIYGHYLTLDAPWTTDKTAVELNSATGCQLRIVLVLIFRIKEEGYPFETSTDQKCFFSFEFTERFGYETLASVRGGSRIFLGEGFTRLLLYFNTHKPHSFFLFCRIPLVVLENRRSSQGGCAPPAPSP